MEGSIRPLDIELVVSQRPEHPQPIVLDDAIEAIGHGRFHYLLLLLTGASLLALVTELINIGFVADAIACELPGGISTAERGILLSAGFAGVVLSSHAWGYVTDTCGRRRALRLSAGSAAICSILPAFFANHVYWMIASRLATGVCVSGIQSAALVYLGEWHTPKRRPQAVTQAAICMVAALMFMAAVAAAILPLAVRLTAFGGYLHVSAWRLEVCTCGLVLVIVFAGLRWLPESPAFLLASGREAEAVEALGRAWRMNGRPGGGGTFGVRKLVRTECPPPTGVWGQTRPILVPPLLGSTALMGYLSFVLFMIAHGANMWMPMVLAGLVAEGNVSESNLCDKLRDSMMVGISVASCNSTVVQGHKNEVLGLLLAYTSGCVGIFFVATLLLRFCGLGRMLAVWLFCSGLAAIVCVHLAEKYSLLVGLIVFLSCGNCGCIVGAMAQDLFPVRVRAMALCVIFALGRLGSVLGSNVIGWLLAGRPGSGSVGECEGFFYGSAALLGSCALMVIFGLPKCQRV